MTQTRFNFPDNSVGPTRLDMPDAEVLFYPSLFSPLESTTFLAGLIAEVEWEEASIVMFGKSVKVPRLLAWYGDEGKTYSYSSLTHVAKPWLPILRTIKTRLEAVAEVSFDSVLLNFYRGGQDSMGWHSDDEPELGPAPVIGSVSFGATRSFQFKHKQRPDLGLSLPLTDGSLLLMRGPTQHFWKHRIPKSSKVTEARINLTFRVIY